MTSGTAAAGLSAGVLPSVALAQDKSQLPEYVAWKNPDAVIVHSEQTIETTREAIGASSITPTNILYVRNNLPAPGGDIAADPDAWEIAFSGVGQERSMTLGELKGFGVETVACVLQCSGNGRAFFTHEASGTKWSVGAAGNVFWTGVPLKAVVAALGGPASGAVYLTATGGEELPAGLDPLSLMVERSVPIEALENALIAYEINGEALPVAHGGPARLVVPGYFGVNNVKYVKAITLSPDESQAKIQQSGYRVRPVGESGGPSQPSMWQMPVKSWITSPLESASSGRVVIEGVAFGGDSEVTGVEVSTDGGANWEKAAFTGPDLGPYAWRPFALITDLAAGTHELVSRATNAAGDAQPEDFPENERGYGNNGWRAHGVSVTLA
ncbi:sulfite oxidase [Acuticoccus kandeliae]|uniref:SorT family sulfite dehydrogenase catalytic subunit n=1 Tax=Acuticoccus kandeliae TaxID=2073160 RepID=UPI001FEB2AEB|nr:sulfite oxidase [Acuticoccus kandeliae]